MQRRSIRQFKKENCGRELVRNIADVAWNAASGVNQHMIHLSIVDDMKVMEEFRTLLYAELKKMAANPGPLARLIRILGEDQEQWLPTDRVLRHAPHFIACSYAEKAITGLPDVFINLSLFEALAIANGIGTLWCGYLDSCLKAIPALREFIGVPAGYNVGYAMLFGFPAVKYKRGVYRHPASVNYVG